MAKLKKPFRNQRTSRAKERLVYVLKVAAPELPKGAIRRWGISVEGLFRWERELERKYRAKGNK